MHLFSLSSQPLNNLVNVGAVKCADGQDHPRGLHDVVQLKLFNELGLSNVRTNVDLIRQNQQRRLTNAAIVQELVKLLFCCGQFLRCRCVDHIQYNVTSLRVSGPFAPILLLSAYIPAFHIHLSIVQRGS